MARGRLLLIGGALLLAGCSMPTTTTDSTNPATLAPEFTISGEPDGVAGAIVVRAWTYCLPGVCADGAPPENLPTVGSPDAVVVRLNKSGWTLNATQEEAGEDCQKSYAAVATKIDESSWRLQPTGTPGAYDVTLEAVERGAGSASATFRWVVPTEAGKPSAAPTCR